jgi:hypothetical protein
VTQNFDQPRAIHKTGIDNLLGSIETTTTNSHFLVSEEMFTREFSSVDAAQVQMRWNIALRGVE